MCFTFNLQADEFFFQYYLCFFLVCFVFNREGKSSFWAVFLSGLLENVGKCDYQNGFINHTGSTHSTCLMLKTLSCKSLHFFYFPARLSFHFVRWSWALRLFCLDICCYFAHFQSSPYLYRNVAFANTLKRHLTRGMNQ